MYSYAQIMHNVDINTNNEKDKEGEVANTHWAIIIFLSLFLALYIYINSFNPYNLMNLM